MRLIMHRCNNATRTDCKTVEEQDEYIKKHLINHNYYSYQAHLLGNGD